MTVEFQAVKIHFDIEEWLALNFLQDYQPQEAFLNGRWEKINS